MTGRTTVPFILSALVLAACGSPAADDNAAEEQLPAVAALSAAFDEAAEAPAFRTSMSMGMTLDMGALGQSMSFDADRATPMMVSESDADGEQHIVMSLAPLMDATLGSNSTDILGGDLEMEIWQSDATMVVDLGGFAPILAQSPETAGALPADVFSVDINRLGEGVAGVDAASLLSGQSVPDPVEMASVLRSALDDVAAVEGEPGHFIGRLTFDDYSAAFGRDPEAMLGGMGESFELMGGADALRALADVFDELVVDVDMRLAADGSVDLVQYDVDMSPLWKALPEIIAASGDGAGGMGEQFAEMFGDFTFDMTMLIDYDLDASVDVELPQGDFPDATDQFLEMFATLGG